MTLKLSREIEQAILNQKGPCSVYGSDDKTQYVVLSREEYDRYQQLLRKDALLEEQKQLIKHLGQRAGWDDPEMDAYDQYEENQSMP